MIDPVIVCEQCAVWRPRDEVSFSLEAAEEHALASHPSRFLRVYRELCRIAFGDEDYVKRVREGAATDLLKNRNAL
jgi:hypothetical protein